MSRATITWIAAIVLGVTLHQVGYWQGFRHGSEEQRLVDKMPLISNSGLLAATPYATGILYGMTGMDCSREYDERIGDYLRCRPYAERADFLIGPADYVMSQIVDEGTSLPYDLHRLPYDVAPIDQIPCLDVFVEPKSREPEPPMTE